ncbi:Trigger factor [Linum perenne]
MVEAAQPIPGFRRVKGGKYKNIPKDILMEILGASRVYKQVIEKVINCSVAEYVEKQGLKVSKDVKVEQCFEALEDAFNPGEKFNFEALLRIQAEPGN